MINTTLPVFETTLDETKGELIHQGANRRIAFCREALGRELPREREKRNTFCIRRAYRRQGREKPRLPYVELKGGLLLYRKRRNRRLRRVFAPFRYIGRRVLDAAFRQDKVCF